MSFATVSIASSPLNWEPVETDGLWFKFTSASFSASGFKYVVNGYSYDLDPSSFTQSLTSKLLSPRPVDGAGLYNPAEMLKSFTNNKWLSNIDLSGAQVTYKVSQDEFFRKKEIRKMIDLSKYEISIIFKTLDDKRIKRKISFSFSSEFVEISTSSSFFEIVKLDDDWFTIIQQDNTGRFGGTKDEFYIADEFEEVVNFLKTFV